MNRYNYTGCDKVYGETYNYIVERKLIVWKLKRLSYIKLVNRAGMRACERKGGGRVTRTGGEGIRSLREDRGSRKKERKRGPKARSDQSRRNDRRPVISRASTRRQVPRAPSPSSCLDKRNRLVDPSIRLRVERVVFSKRYILGWQLSNCGFQLKLMTI